MRQQYSNVKIPSNSYTFFTSASQFTISFHYKSLRQAFNKNSIKILWASQTFIKYFQKQNIDLIRAPRDRPLSKMHRVRTNIFGTMFLGNQFGGGGGGGRWQINTALHTILLFIIGTADTGDVLVASFREVKIQFCCLILNKRN